MPRRWNGVKRAMGVTRIEIEALLSQGLPNTPMAGAFLRVHRRQFHYRASVGPWSDGIDFQYTGSIRKVIAKNPGRLAQENVVLITPMALHHRRDFQPSLGRCGRSGSRGGQGQIS